MTSRFPASAVIALAAVAGTAVARPVRAARVPVDLRIDRCVDTDSADVSRLLGIELDAVTAGRSLEGVRLEASVDCEGELALVRVVDPVTDKALERAIRLKRAVPSARSRLLALAIVELLVASWTELAIAKPPDPPTDAPPERARQEAHAIATAQLGGPVAPPAPRKVHLFVEAGGTQFFTRMGRTVAGGVRLTAETSRRTTLALGVRLERGDAQTRYGAVSFESLSVAPTLMARAHWGPLTFLAGPGVRAGLGRLAGSPTDP